MFELHLIRYSLRMERLETYLPSKLMFQNRNYFQISLLVGIFLIISVMIYQNMNSCITRQFLIIDEISQYESEMDYSKCVSLAEKIQAFNTQCSYDFDDLECD